jgi:hypothetical protein
LIGFIVLFAGLIASRFITEGALTLLSTEKKAELIDAFSAHRKFSLPLLAIILVATFNWPMAMIGAVIVYVVATQAWAYRRLKKLEMPPAYVRRFGLAALVSLCALSGLVAIMFVTP